jgi:NAD(P)-dependent dehydrogenase (short-subunit alcohol dehydrogenase family)
MSRTPQHKLPSGYNRTTTVTEVLKGVDLTGRTAVVTGGYSGLGLEVTKGLAEAGADVVVPARRPDVAARTLDGIPRVRVDGIDLGDQASIRSFARRFLDADRPLDILINNAAVLATSEQRIGPGWEMQFAVNHLGPYALTNLLWPALAAAGGPARVVTVSSWGHKSSPVHFEDVMLTRNYDMNVAYCQSKTANSLFAVHLDTLAEPSRVRSFAAAPGSVLTPLLREVPKQYQVDVGWIDEHDNPSDWFVRADQGPATFVWAATSPQLAGRGGVYCEACDIAEPTVPGAPGSDMTGVDAHAIDPDAAARLWTLSAELTGIDAFHELS